MSSGVLSELVDPTFVGCGWEGRSKESGSDRSRDRGGPEDAAVAEDALLGSAREEAGVSRLRLVTRHSPGSVPLEADVGGFPYLPPGPG